MKQILQHTAHQGLRAAILLVLATSVSFPQASSTRQTLLLEVVEVTKISINKDFLALAVNGFQSASSGVVEATSTDCALSWTTNGGDKKITVENAANRNRFLLRLAVEALESGIGVPVGEIAFQDNATRDFIRGVSRSAGECKLRLTAQTNATEYPGNETHLMTYTITNN
jgi:hypothetical protein